MDKEIIFVSRFLLWLQNTLEWSSDSRAGAWKGDEALLATKMAETEQWKQQKFQLGKIWK